MAEHKLDVLEQIQDYLKNKTNFVLNGGAGSGKTHTLGKTLEYIYQQDANARVACITYTNVAVDEIKNRFSYESLSVGTIHEFLWSNIHFYQQYLKKLLVDNIQNQKISYKGELELNEDYFIDKVIQYKEYTKVEEGIISHDEVRFIAHQMYNQYSKLRKIFSDKYDFILLDEYQDTHEDIVEIFLKYMNEYKKIIFCFFGDPMQSIYGNSSIGDIKKYINNKQIKEIRKEDNYRCSKAVINFINYIRKDEDGLEQKPSKVDDSGQIINKEGKVLFVYSDIKQDINDIKKHTIFSDWVWDNSKELYLTHKLLANHIGYQNLLNSYTKHYDRRKDRLVADYDQKDTLAKQLHKISRLIVCYDNKKYQDLIRYIDYPITKLGDKKCLNQDINTIKNLNIHDAIEKANEQKLVLKDEKFYDYINDKDNKTCYDSVSEISLLEAIKLYEYEVGYLPFSTQHNVKGAEFENVFIILDNGRWNQYNFEYLLTDNNTKNLDTYNRTKKLFYVCCSRPQDNLVLYMYQPSSQIISYFTDKQVKAIKI